MDSTEQQGTRDLNGTGNSADWETGGGQVRTALWQLGSEYAEHCVQVRPGSLH